MVSTDDVLNTNNNETSFPEIRKVSKLALEIKTQEGYILKYYNFSICQSPVIEVRNDLGFIPNYINLFTHKQ